MGGTKQLLSLYRVLLLFLLIFMIVRSAWVSDDSLITLRTLLNVSHGWGPGYNATESVQAFTHPLWFLLWLGIGSGTGQWLLAVLFMGVALSALTLFLLLCCASTFLRMSLIATLVLLSNSVFDFTTSGLENPLAFVIIAALFLFTEGISRGRGTMTWWQAALLGLLIAAIALTRLDLLVLLLPVLLLVVRLRRRDVRGLVTAAIFILAPLLGWFTWSYLTYSSILPNTFLAKTNTLIPRFELILNGVRYLWVSFSQDPISLLIMVSALLLVLFYGTAAQRAWGLGAALYLLYVVWIGGDFMAGRFLAVPVLVALFLLATIAVTGREPRTSDPTPVEQMTLAASLAILLGLGTQWMGIQTTSLANPQSPRWDLHDWGGVADERGEYVQRGWTLADLLELGGDSNRGEDFRATSNQIGAWPLGQEPLQVPSEVVVTCGLLGIQGIQGGPTVHIIDECALADRFLAEQVYVPSYRLGWRPGHLDRDIPAGYVEAVANNDPSFLVDPNERQRLTELWERIR